MNRYREAWEKLEAPDSRPSYARNIVEADYAEFADRVVAHEPRFVNDVVESLYAGDIYLLKRGFSREFMHDLLEKVYSLWSRSPSSFHKMLEGCPDFHVGPGNRLVDLEDRIDVGDIGIGFATIMHGVDRIDPHKLPDWKKKDGRWWLGLYSNSTDHVEKRATGKPVRMTLKTE